MTHLLFIFIELDIKDVTICVTRSNGDLFIFNSEVFKRKIG